MREAEIRRAMRVEATEPSAGRGRASTAPIPFRRYAKAAAVVIFLRVAP